MLDSLTPVEQDANALGRVLFEPEALEQQLDQLIADVAALRERVQHLVGLVPDDAVASASPAAESSATKTTTTKKKKKKKKNAEDSGKGKGKKAEKP